MARRAHSGLPPEEIARRITKALSKDGTHTFNDMVDMLKAGEAQIFCDDHGAWITRIIEAPRMRYLHVWVVAGQLPEVMKLQPKVEAFAKANGCKRITATCRFGWKDVAREHGWKEHAMIITHEVGDNDA